MTQLHLEQCELTYEGFFATPAFSLVDSAGKLCEFLLTMLERFDCAGDDLFLEEGEIGERGVACEIEPISTRVTIRGDRVEVHCSECEFATTGKISTILEDLRSGLQALS